MKQTLNERFILFLVSIACIGLSIKSLLAGWEFWVPPIIIAGTIMIWVVHVARNPEYKIRKIFYFLFALFVTFFHGVHYTSFFDVSIVFLMVIVTYSFFDDIYMINIFMLEYFAIIGIQIRMALKEDYVDFDVINVSRIILHVFIVCLIYFVCTKSINDRNERNDSDVEKDRRIEAVEADMEDFLTNISHELRTPVNVVNGMSEMLIKKGAGEEAFSIKNAGIRLAYQIEDIQDYTECKRDKIILEEDDYISTSLINDVVTSFRLLENDKKLELIVDIDPKVPSKMRGDVKKLHKIFRHLLENAFKFTKRGGIYVKMFAENEDYGVNLCIEMTDTGIGMDSKSVAALSEGLFQVNKKRNRSSGGIGLGLYIVYGFAHRMGGFVKIESEKNVGTTVRVTIPQKVTDKTPCLALTKDFSGDILFHVRDDKYKLPKVRDFYRTMATNLATGIRVPLYPAQSIKEIAMLR